MWPFRTWREEPVPSRARGAPDLTAGLSSPPLTEKRSSQLQNWANGGERGRCICYLRTATAGHFSGQWARVCLKACHQLYIKRNCSLARDDKRFFWSHGVKSSQLTSPIRKETGNAISGVPRALWTFSCNKRNTMIDLKKKQKKKA
jgi:hypothetical protein